MLNYNGQLLTSYSQINHQFFRKILADIHMVETIRILHDKILFWEYHYFRLMASLRLLRVEIPNTFTMDALEKEVLSFGRDTSIRDDVELIAKFYLVVGKKITTKISSSVDFLIEWEPADSFFAKPKVEAHKVDIFDEVRIISNKLSTQTNSNKLVFEIAHAYAEDNQLDSCILINQDRFLTESTRGSLFLLNHNQKKIFTPSEESGCRNLAIRSALIQHLFKQTDYSVIQTKIEQHLLKKVDEVFAVSVEYGVTHFTNYRGSYFEYRNSQSIFETFTKSLV